MGRNVRRVSGVKSGGIYAGHNNQFYGHRKILKPDHLDWQEYALLLLNSMPEKTADHYRNKIAVYLHWYQKKGIEIPQTQQGDIGSKDVPPGDVSARYYSTMIIGAGRYHSALQKLKIINVITNG